MKIFVIGSGNVATHLTKGFAVAGHQIAGVCSSTRAHAVALAQQVGCEAYGQLADIPVDTDFYIISVSDDSVKKVVEQLPLVRGVVSHTAGSISINVLERFENHGVIYPMQSFTKNRVIDLGKVPFFVEGSSDSVSEKLLQLASTVGSDVRLMSSEERKILHLSAVFASNFVNGMFAEAEEILKRCGLPFSILQPLVEETVAKAIDMGPVQAQTGPARRNDAGVMRMQQNMLDDENLRKLYSFASERITERYAGKKQ